MELRAAKMGYESHKIYVDCMNQVEQNRSDMVSALAILGGMKFKRAVQWVANSMAPGQTFDEALDAAHAWNTTFAQSK